MQWLVSLWINLLLLLVLTLCSRRPMRRMRRCLWVTWVELWLLLTLREEAVVSISSVAELVLLEITSIMGVCSLRLMWVSGCLKWSFFVGQCSEMSGTPLLFMRNSPVRFR